MKSVLVFMPDVPYPLSYGGRIEYYNKLRVLKRLYEKVYLVFTYNSAEEVEIFQEEANKLCDDYICWPRNKSFSRAFHFKPYYAISCLPNSREKNRLELFVLKYITEISLIVCDQPHMYEVVKVVKDIIKINKMDIPVVYRKHNNEARFMFDQFISSKKISLRPYFFAAEAFRMWWYEQYIHKNSNCILCVSQKENQKMLNQGLVSYWIPIAYRVYNEAYLDLSTIEEKKVYKYLQEKCSNNKVIYFCSSFHGGFNVNLVHWFVESVLPIIRREIPNTIFLFGGGKAKEYFQYRREENILVFSDVKSIKPYIKIADMSLVLTKSRAGVKLKLIESLFYKKKVVSTVEGVMGSGLDEILPNTNDSQKFAQYCIDVLVNNVNYEEIWMTYQNIYSSKSIEEKYASVLNNL